MISELNSNEVASISGGGEPACCLIPISIAAAVLVSGGVILGVGIAEDWGWGPSVGGMMIAFGGMGCILSMVGMCCSLRNSDSSHYESIPSHGIVVVGVYVESR